MSTSSTSLTLSLQDWQQVTSSFGKDGLPMPFVQEIFLVQCQVAGTTHVEGIRQKTSELMEGTVLAFKREPGNPVDEKAILILNQANQKIGYVPRDSNEILANLMDAGKLVFGKVLSRQEQGNWIKIGIKVYMRDL